MWNDPFTKGIQLVEPKNHGKLIRTYYNYHIGRECDKMHFIWKAPLCHPKKTHTHTHTTSLIHFSKKLLDLTEISISHTHQSGAKPH